MSTLAALVTPFAKGAEGAQFGDVYSTNSETMTLKGQIDIDLSFWAQNDQKPHNGFDMALLCHPEQFLLTQFYGPIAKNKELSARTLRENCNPVVINWGSGGGYDDPNNTQKIMQIMPLINTTPTGNQVSEFANVARYRVLGAGVRMTSNMWPESATGHIQVYNGIGCDTLIPNDQLAAGGTVAIPDKINNKISIRDATDVSTLATYYGQPWTTGVGFANIELNKNMAQDLKGDKVDIYTFNRHGIEAVFKPYSEDAFEWREASGHSLNKADGTGALAIGVNTGTGTTNSYDSSRWSVKGWNTICIKGVNLPNATKITTAGGNGQTLPSPIMTLEVIMHLEYVPNKVITNTSGGVPKSRASVDYLLKKASYYPIFRQLYINRLSVKKMRSKLGY